MSDREQERLKEMWRKQELAAGRNPDRGSSISWVLLLGALIAGAAIWYFTK